MELEQAHANFLQVRKQLKVLEVEYEEFEQIVQKLCPHDKVVMLRESDGCGGMQTTWLCLACKKLEESVYSALKLQNRPAKFVNKTEWESYSKSTLSLSDINQLSGFKELH